MSACSNCSLAPSNSTTTLVGWEAESPGRGTLTLIANCSVTVFLCTWVVIHPRVYKRRLYGTLHKFALFLKCILAPEFIAVEALQEWTQCRKMVEDCREITEEEFKLIHAFYISMLALRYRTPHGDKVLWPNQYTWLLKQGLISWKDHKTWGLSEGDIRDRSNTDSAVKLVAFSQVFWFVAQSIMRTAHQLPLSQLESMSISYIPLFATTYLFWWVKPKDIAVPTIVDLPQMFEEQIAEFEGLAISNKFDDEGHPEQVSLWNIWYLTPRVFEKEAEDRALSINEIKVRKSFQKEPNSGTEQGSQSIASSQSNYDLTTNELVQKKEVVLAHWDPELYHSKLWPVICLFGISFGALHLISWHTVFPTEIEAWLWRVAALVSIFSMLVFMHFEKVVLRWGGPLTLISLLSPVLYFLSRLVMMGEVIAALRAQEAGIYETYVVSTYWVHIL